MKSSINDSHNVPPANKDIHRLKAAEIFDVPVDQVTDDQRRSAKAINFGLIHGMSTYELLKFKNNRSSYVR